jgi:hypothetical protein
MGPGDFISGSETNVLVPLSGGSVRNFRVRLSNVLTQGSFTFTVRKNSVLTSITCIISTVTPSQIDCSDTTHVAVFAPGDYLSVQSTPDSGPPLPSLNVIWSLTYETGVTLFTGGSGGNILVPGGLAGATQFLGVGNSISSTEANVQVPDVAGTVGNLRVTLSTAAAGGSITFTVMRNGIPQGVTCTIAVASTACSSIPTLTATFVPGDKLDVKVAIAPGMTGGMLVGFSLTLGP